MPRAQGTSPNQETARLIVAYTHDIVDELGADEQPIALLTAVIAAIDAEETCHLGRALIARHNALADPPYRTTGDSCERRLAEIDARLNKRRAHA